AAALEAGSVWRILTPAYLAAARAASAAASARKYRARTGRGTGRPAEKAERAAQSCLLRDIFGPRPFRPVAVDPGWLSWNAATTRGLAGAIYEERAFDRLPILADALEEAGCADADLLSHCRQPGEHVRGCWVVDLLLGKV